MDYHFSYVAHQVDSQMEIAFILHQASYCYDDTSTKIFWYVATVVYVNISVILLILKLSKADNVCITIQGMGCFCIVHLASLIRHGQFSIADLTNGIFQQRDN